MSLTLAHSAAGTRPVQAQIAPLTLADLVGTWEAIIGQNTPRIGGLRMGSGHCVGQNTSLIYQSVTFRPDSALLATTICALHGRYEGDTVASTSKAWLGGLRGDTLHWGYDFYSRHRDSKVPVILHLENRELSWTAQGEKTGSGPSYRWVEPSQRAFGRVIAAGVVSGRPMPAHPKQLTGTLADLVGVWRASPPPRGEEGDLEYWILRPDSTSLRVSRELSGRDTLVNGGIDTDWKYGTQPWARDWKRQPGDSLITRVNDPDGVVWKLVVQSHQLSLFFRDEASVQAQNEDRRGEMRKPRAVFTAVDRLPQP